MVKESEVKDDHSADQLDLFTDYAAQAARQEEEAQALEKEKKVQQEAFGLPCFCAQDTVQQAFFSVLLEPAGQVGAAG